MYQTTSHKAVCWTPCSFRFTSLTPLAWKGRPQSFSQIIPSCLPDFITYLPQRNFKGIQTVCGSGQGEWNEVAGQGWGGEILHQLRVVWRVNGIFGDSRLNSKTACCKHNYQGKQGCCCDTEIIRPPYGRFASPVVQVSSTEPPHLLSLREELHPQQLAVRTLPSLAHRKRWGDITISVCKQQREQSKTKQWTHWLWQQKLILWVAWSVGVIWTRLPEIVATSLLNSFKSRFCSHRADNCGLPR